MKNSIRYIIAKNNNGKEIGWLSSGPYPSNAFNMLAAVITAGAVSPAPSIIKYAEYVEKNVNIGKDEILEACNAMISALNNNDCKFEIESVMEKKDTNEATRKSSTNHAQLPFSPGDIVELVKYDGLIMSDYGGVKNVGDKYRVIAKPNEPEKVRLTVDGMVECENINNGKVIHVSPLCLKLSMKLDAYNSVSRAFSYAFGELLTDLNDVRAAIKSGHFTERDILSIVSDAIKSIK